MKQRKSGAAVSLPESGSLANFSDGATEGRKERSFTKNMPPMFLYLFVASYGSGRPPSGGKEVALSLRRCKRRSDRKREGTTMRSKLVMVIDDSPTVRKILEVSLRREGLEVVSYPDGIEALRAVTDQQIERLPDLVILDIDLPKMNGYEIARYLRTKPQWSRTVIIILSRHDGVIDRLKARLAGTQAYLTKPFTTQMIVDVVNTNLYLQ